MHVLLCGITNVTSHGQVLLPDLTGLLHGNCIMLLFVWATFISL
jgi:hypothetical protein